MTNKPGLRVSPLLLGAAILALLLFRFGPYIQPQSFDLVQHYLLVNEIMKHATVMPDAYSRMGAMAVYPPVAHWMAAVIGWIGGSGLVGITLISIVSVYASYLLISRLIGSTVGIILFFALFWLFRDSGSQVGWEVVTNFFYPQLVAGVVYFAVLLWAAHNRTAWQQAVAFVIAGTLAMWIQPLVATHILAAGCALMAFYALTVWRDKLPVWRPLALFGVTLLASAAIVAFHPAFRVMRTIAGNDGYLVFGYGHVLMVAVLCGLVGAFNLRRRADYIDAVLGCAVIASMGLVLLQFAAWKFHGDGSPYAVKKHMFLVVTLGMMNFVRAVVGYWPAINARWNPRLLAPIAAGAMSFFVLRVFNWPVAPIVNAMAYAQHAADYELPGFAPGNTVIDASPLLLSNVIISLTAFEHPFDAQAIGWLQGKKIKDGAKFVMVPRTPEIDANCAERYTEGERYVIVGAACLK